MKKSLIAGAAAGLALSFAAVSAGPVDAAPPKGIQCQKRGIATLNSLGLTSSVARNGIEVVGVGTVPFRTVLSLHRSNPELFQTGGVSVVVGDDDVPATWCNGL
jgi:2-polyprenyl-6-methoxyphenol hydroxylase-like FAD-dependent oxidoreductase